MKKTQFNKNIFFEWIDSFIAINGNSPGLRDMYRYKGCPYCKEVILKEFKSIGNLYSKYGGDKRKFGYDQISDEKLLCRLKLKRYNNIVTSEPNRL